MVLGKRRIWVVVVVALLAAGCTVTTTIDGGGSGTRTTIEASGTVKEEARPLGDFDGIDLRSIGDVYVELGFPDRSVTVVADEAVLGYLVTDVRGGTLEISVDESVTLRDPGPIEFRVKASTLDFLTLSGAGKIETTTPVQTNSLEVRLKGSGTIDLLEFQGDRIAAVIDGAGDISIHAGTTGDASFRIAGLGDVAASGLVADQVEVSIDGSGSAAVNAVIQLDVTINGLGSVTYAGSPRIDKSISGSGSVDPIG